MGNYVGDFVKGLLTAEKTKDWNGDYLLGLKLHRFIDSFTDTHELVREAKKVAAVSNGKLAGIVTDIYFDHFLARYFDDFFPEPLFVYAHHFYTIIEKNEHMVPEVMIPMMRSMIRQDWLTGYATLEGIDLTFQRLSRRADFLAPIRTATKDLQEHESFYFEIFKLFFPVLQERSARFITENAR